jgi:hypothetical protein
MQGSNYSLPKIRDVRILTSGKDWKPRIRTSFVTRTPLWCESGAELVTLLAEGELIALAMAADAKVSRRTAHGNRINNTRLPLAGAAVSVWRR